MKEEIKEMLVNKLDTMEELQKNSSTIFLGELKETILYITQLNQEIDKLNKLLNQADSKNLELIEEINQLEDVRYDLDRVHLEKRIDKAIEYVNTHKPSDTISFPLMKKDEENQVKSCFDYEFREIYQKELLDILQGSDKNV